MEKYQTTPNIDECLDQLKTDRKLAVAVSRHHSQNYPSESAYRMTCFDESQSIQSYFISMYIRSDHPYLNEISIVTQCAFEGGLFVKWMRDAHITNKKYVVHELSGMGTKHLGGAVFGFSVLITCSVLAFVLEMLAYKRARHSHPKKFWIIVDKFVNADRLFLNGFDRKNPIRRARTPMRTN